jgi:SAM-dependent methyltransferase
MNTPRPPPGPDRSSALAQYRQRASTYDLELALFEPLRRAAIEQLALKAGAVVLDVGCGTGLSLEALRQGVGSGGRVVGVEQSPEMIQRARERVARGRWPNVRLLCAPAETARLPGRADAALFHFTHDILRRPEAVAHVVRHLKPGARVVACGLKWTTDWGGLANLFVLPAALRSVSCPTQARRSPACLRAWESACPGRGPNAPCPVCLGSGRSRRSPPAFRCAPGWSCSGFRCC